MSEFYSAGKIRYWLMNGDGKMEPAATGFTHIIVFIANSVSWRIGDTVKRHKWREFDMSEYTLDEVNALVAEQIKKQWGKYELISKVDRYGVVKWTAMDERKTIAAIHDYNGISAEGRIQQLEDCH